MAYPATLIFSDTSYNLTNSPVVLFTVIIGDVKFTITYAGSTVANNQLASESLHGMVVALIIGIIVVCCIVNYIANKCIVILT